MNVCIDGFKRKSKQWIQFLIDSLQLGSNDCLNFCGRDNCLDGIMALVYYERSNAGKGPIDVEHEKVFLKNDTWHVMEAKRFSGLIVLYGFE